MRGSPENLAVLRNLLAERFPAAASRSGGMLATEIAAIDEVADGGLPAGALTEIVSAQPSSGGQLLILRLLERIRDELKLPTLLVSHAAAEVERLAGEVVTLT